MLTDTQKQCNHTHQQLVSEPSGFAWQCSTCERHFPLIPTASAGMVPHPPLTAPDTVENRISIPE